jgi:hypothetical protein
MRTPHADSPQFNAFDHSTIHWSMALVFIVGVALSAIFQTGELVRDDDDDDDDDDRRTRRIGGSLGSLSVLTTQWSLHKDHPDRKSLLRNSVYKWIIVVVAVACAIAFGATYAVVSAPELDVHARPRFFSSPKHNIRLGSNRVFFLREPCLPVRV